MQDQIVSLFTWLFNYMTSLSVDVNSFFGSSGTSVVTMVNNIATAIKPIGYGLLALFALLEFAQLSERVGNVTGFMGAGLVINVLVKLCLCKLVVDNSTEICSFLITLSDNITTKIGAASVSSVNVEQFKQNIQSAFPNWWDIFGQLGFFIVSTLFIFISSIAITMVKIIYAARYIQLYAMSAFSPIPLSTCLSKHFNSAPNYIKSFFAVCLQGGLLILVIKIFNVIFVAQINGIGTLAQGDWGALWGMLGSVLFNSILLLVSSFQTQKWANSICHAM